MREIKFRAWDKKAKKWLSFDEGEPIESDYTRLNTLGYWVHFWNYDEKEVALMQFTGLKDKNGKEIYEGDVLKSKYATGHNVYWQGCGWKMSTQQGGYWQPLQTLTDNYEVIGNIFENPELLNKD